MAIMFTLKTNIVFLNPLTMSLNWLWEETGAPLGIPDKHATQKWQKSRFEPKTVFMLIKSKNQHCDVPPLSLGNFLLYFYTQEMFLKNEAQWYSIQLSFFLLLIPWCRNPHFPTTQVIQSTRLTTETCHWSFETFAPFHILFVLHVSRWSVKERWAAAGPVLPARTTNLYLMSTLVEPVSWAPGPQMICAVNILFYVSVTCKYKTYKQARKALNLGHTLTELPQIPLTSYVPHIP